MTDRICPETGKRMHKRHEANRIVRIAQRQAHSAQRPASAYRCPYCRKWHTTGLTRFEYRVLQVIGRAA